MRTALIGIALLAAVGAAQAAEYRPNDVRPWAAFVETRKAIRDAAEDGRVREPADAAKMAVDLMGPLPWRFEPEAGTPIEVSGKATEITADRIRTGGRPIIVTSVMVDYPSRQGDTTGKVQSQGFEIWSVYQGIRPQDDGSKYLYELGYRSGYR